MLDAKPSSPGELLMLFLDRMGRRQSELATAMGVSRVIINKIANGRAPITARMAVRLGTATATPPEYWLGIQSKYDLEEARRELGPELKRLPVLAPAITPNRPAFLELVDVAG